MHIPGWHRHETADAAPEDDPHWGQGARPGVLLEAGDGWSRAVGGPLLGQDQLRVLRDLLHPDRGSSPYRTARWQESADALAHKENRTAREAVLALLEALADGAPYLTPDPRADARAVLVSRDNAVRAVNTIWTSVQLDHPRVSTLIGRVLIRTLTEPWVLDSGARIREAARTALALDGGRQARTALEAAVSLASNSALREELAWSLSTASIGQETPPSRIDELRVADHGLDEAGLRRLTVNRRGYLIRIDPGGKVTLAPDRPQRTRPDDVAAEEIAKTEVRAVSATYRREVERIEDLLATDRDWPLARWRRLYLGNPITRCVAARTVWVFTNSDERALSVLPDWEGRIRAVNGSAQPTDWPAGAVTVRLWHPRDARPEELAAWRALLADPAVGLAQPFQQIERDFTRVAPDPEATESELCVGVRFDPSAFKQATRRLRWYPRGRNEASNTAAVRFYQRDFPDARVSITLTAVSRDLQVELDTAWFHRAGNTARIPLPLGSIPARVYSEAVRDLAVLASAGTGVY